MSRPHNKKYFEHQYLKNQYAMWESAQPYFVGVYSNIQSRECTYSLQPIKNLGVRGLTYVDHKWGSEVVDSAGKIVCRPGETIGSALEIEVLQEWDDKAWHETVKQCLLPLCDSHPNGWQAVPKDKVGDVERKEFHRWIKSVAMRQPSHAKAIREKDLIKTHRGLETGELTPKTWVWDRLDNANHWILYDFRDAQQSLLFGDGACALYDSVEVSGFAVDWCTLPLGPKQLFMSVCPRAWPDMMEFLATYRPDDLIEMFNRGTVDRAEEHVYFKDESYGPWMREYLNDPRRGSLALPAM